MATSFDLAEPWRRHWKIKIRDKETVEPPHVSLLSGTDCWRLCLRTRLFLDCRPDPDEVPRRLLKHILSRLDEFIAVWDATYPHNPVSSQEPGNDED